MTNPYARILVTRADGTLAVLLYEKNSGVMAWTRIALAHGEIRSVAVTRGEGGCDIVYFVVYTPSGEFFLERLDMEKLVYLDSYTSFTGATNGYSDKAIIFNATRQKEITVAKYNAMSAEKRAAFYAAGDEAYIGYEYESRIRSMPVLNDDVTGKKRIAKLVVRFLESYRPVLQVEGRPDEPFTDFNEPFSGIKSIDYPGEHKRDVYFTLTAHGAQPCTVLAVNAILYQA